MHAAALPAGALAFALLAPAATSQQEAQLFDSAVLAVPDIRQRLNALLDLDGDGWTDAVGTFMPNSVTGGVYGFRNDGTGRLQPAFEFEWSQYGNNTMPFPVVAGDLNGDGLADFAAGLRDEIRIYRSNGAAPPTLSAYVYLGSGNEAHDLELGDYDGDGDLELAVRLYAPATQDKGLRIYDNVASTSPSAAWFVQPAPGAGMFMRNAEVDGDGADDLMLVGEMRVDFLALRNGALAAVGSYPHGLTGIAGGASGDLDGDGDLDAVAFAMPGEYAVLRRVGARAFVVEPPEAGGPATGLADVDSDGDLDGVCCGGGGGTTWFSNWAPSWFEIALNDGTGAFDPSFRLLGMGSNEIAGVDDIDQDGDQDLIAGRVIYYNVDGIEPAAYASAKKWIQEGAVHDLDGDGDPDVADSADLGKWERNRADGVLAHVTRLVPAPPPGHSFIGPGFLGDVDGDGDVDTIVAEMSGAVAFGERLLLNTGGGALMDGGIVSAPGVHFLNAFQPNYALFADVNGDGRADLVTRRAFSAGETRVWTQGRDGVFAEGVTFPGEYAHAAADLDGDGFDDLAVLDAASFFVRFGDSAGALSAKAAFPAPAGQFEFNSEVEIADLDGDGDLDLVGPVHVAGGSPYDESLRILENVGARSFTVRDDSLAHYKGYATALQVLDANMDGTLDVGVAYRHDELNDAWLDAMSFYLGSTTQPWRFDYTGGEQYPMMLKVADLDGDGDLDGIGDLNGVMSRALHGPAAGYKLQYGTATPGLGGETPTLGAKGPIRDKASVTLSVTGAAPNSLGFLVVGTGTGVLPLGATGGLIEVLPAIALFKIPFPSATGLWGSGAIDLVAQIPDGVGGLTFTHQVIVLDPHATGGASVSNALLLTYGEG
jgi:hypothetical protein